METNKTLTSGNIRRQLLFLALPLLLGNILQQFYNTIVTVIVGKYVGETAYAAVGVAGSVMNLFLFLISGACTGVGILLSQFYGCLDFKKFRRCFYLATVAGALLTLLLSVLALGTVYPLLRLLQTPEEVIPYTVSYLRLIYAGLIFSFIYNLSAAVLRSVGNTKASLYFLILSILCNLILALWFVAGLSLGTAGGALATVISQFIAALLCVLYLLRRFPQLIFHREDMVMDLPLLKKAGQFSFVSALQQCNLYIGKLLVQGTVNALGTEAITAYTAALRIEGFANSFGDSASASMSIFIGQNTGANQKRRISQGYRTGQTMIISLGIVMSLIMIVFATPLLQLVLPAESSSSLLQAVNYLRYVSMFYVLNFYGSGLSGYFQGRGKVHLPVIGTTMQITIRVVLAFLLAPTYGLPIIGIVTGIGWIAYSVFATTFRRKDARKLDSCLAQEA